MNHKGTSSNDDETPKNKKNKKTKMKCQICGHIDYRLQCPKCDGAMFPDKTSIDI